MYGVHACLYMCACGGERERAKENIVFFIQQKQHEHVFGKEHNRQESATDILHAYVCMYIYMHTTCTVSRASSLGVNHGDIQTYYIYKYLYARMCMRTYIHTYIRVYPPLGEQ